MPVSEPKWLLHFIYQESVYFTPDPSPIYYMFIYVYLQPIKSLMVSKPMYHCIFCTVKKYHLFIIDDSVNI